MSESKNSSLRMRQIGGDDLAEQQSLDNATVPPDLVKIYIYRHLLRNMESKRKAREEQEKRQAPRVKGPRAAALLARLWANEDLGLQPIPQKVIAHELGLGESEVLPHALDGEVDPEASGCCTSNQGTRSLRRS